MLYIHEKCLFIKILFPAVFLKFNELQEKLIENSQLSMVQRKIKNNSVWALMKLVKVGKGKGSILSAADFSNSAVQSSKWSQSKLLALGFVSLYHWMFLIWDKIISEFRQWEKLFIMIELIK